MAKSHANPTESAEVEAVVNELIAAEMRALERNVPIGISMELAADEQKRDTLLGMNWWVRKFDVNAVLIGDRPLLTTPAAKWPCGIPLDVPRCVIALPISPRAIFFASPEQKSRSQMSKMNPGAILHSVNSETLRRAVEYVFASNTEMGDFVSPEIFGDANDAWRL